MYYYYMKVSVTCLMISTLMLKFKTVPLSPILFLFIELIATGGIVVLPSGRRIGVTVTSSHSIGT